MGICISGKPREVSLGVGSGLVTPRSVLSQQSKIQWIATYENLRRITSEYKLGADVIGSGSFGEVRRAIHVKSGEERAVKLVYKSHLSKHKQRKIMNEIYVQQKADHPYIAKLFEYFQDHKFLYIVMEYVPGGELLSKMKGMKRLTENVIARLFFQLMSAVNYLHGRGVAHRDLKPENVMLDESENVKLVDFGTSREFLPGERMKGCHGTPYFIAPEVLAGDYSEKCDIWSAGVVLHVLLTGVPPFSGKTEEEVLAAVKAANVNYDAAIFKGVSRTALDLLRNMLSSREEKRPSAAEVLKHPWFKLMREKPEMKKAIDAEIIRNISKFEAKSQLQRAIYYFLVNNLVSKEEKQQFAEAFEELDSNHDGVLSRRELLDWFESVEGLVLSRPDMDLIIDRLDSTGSNEINYSEFLGAAMDRKKAISKARIRKVFAIFDQDANGKITPAEFKWIFKNTEGVGERQWIALIKEIDPNGNGEIDYSEFEQALMKLAQD